MLITVYTNDRGLAAKELGWSFKAWSEETAVDIDHPVEVHRSDIYKTPADEEYTDRFTVKGPRVK